jgi:hypothetical protein
MPMSEVITRKQTKNKNEEKPLKFGASYHHPVMCGNIERLRSMSYDFVHVQIRATLSKYPVKTRLSLSGTLIVARDIAHAKLKERLDAGQGLPDYVKNHLIYYAGIAPSHLDSTQSPRKTGEIQVFFLADTHQPPFCCRLTIELG